MKRIRLWFRALFRSSSVERELKEEILHHLEMEILKNLRAGMSEKEARRRATLDFGGVDRFMEQTREVRRTRVLENLAGDLRYALRGLRKAPGFAAVTVLTLAIGIGANSAIFSVVSGVLLKPLPFPGADHLVFINSYWTPESGYDFADYVVGSPEYFDYLDQNRSLESVAAFSTELITLTAGDGDPEVIPAGWVSPNLFTVLRTPPLLGRTLVEDDGGPEPAMVVVLSYDLWQRRFGGDPTILGRRLALGMEVSEEPVMAEIVGVMPYGFSYPRKGTQLWGPMPLDRARTWRGGHWFEMVGRRNRGITLESAQAELSSLMEQWAITYPDHHVGHGLQMRSLLDEEVGQARPILILLLGSVGFVLLIACANVASLLLARAEKRTREIALRRALGAGRARLIQQGLTESFLLAVVGGGLGVLLAWVGVRALMVLEAGAIPRADEVGLDLNVLAFTGVTILATTLLFGLMPAIREAAVEAAATLKDVGRTSTTAAKHVRFRKGLVVGEIALSVFLVTGAGLFLRSFTHLLAEDTGFPTENLYFARFSLPAAEYSPEEAVVFFDQLLDGVRGLPMVGSATLVNRPPLLWRDQGGRFHIEGRQAAPSGPLCCMADPVSVGEDFFETMGVSLVRGRLLGPADHDIDAAPVVVVDQAAADRWWPGEDPVGQRMKAGSEEAPWMTVVGIVGDVVFDGPGETWPHFYTPHNPTARSHPFLTLSTYLTVRAGGDLQALPEGIRGIVLELDSDLAIADSYTMDEILERAVARPRFITSVLAFFSMVALILGAVGVYGVISYAVALRAGEIGIKRALGANGKQVVVMILWQGLVLTLIGLVLGLAGSFAGGRVIGGFLHGVSPTDPLTYFLVAVGILFVAFLASYVPARRAGGIDPLDALRME